MKSSIPTRERKAAQRVRNQEKVEGGRMQD